MTCVTIIKLNVYISIHICTLDDLSWGKCEYMFKFISVSVPLCCACIGAVSCLVVPRPFSCTDNPSHQSTMPLIATCATTQLPYTGPSSHYKIQSLSSPFVLRRSLLLSSCKVRHSSALYSARAHGTFSLTTTVNIWRQICEASPLG